MNNTHLAENLKNISKGSLILFYFFAIILIFFGCLVLLPFYVYVNKVNRSRDEKTLVFPITNHFYKMIKGTYVLFVSMLVFVGMTTILMEKHIYIAVLLVILIFLCYITLSVIFQVFHVFISLLAIQRVILHFFPQTEQFIANTQHKFFKRTWCIYFIFGIKDFTSVITYIKCLKNDTCDQEKPSLVQVVTFIVSNGLLLISALLYLPIIVNIGKFSHLPMAKQNNPQKYIFLQTVFILVLKSFSIPIVYFFYSEGNSFTYLKAVALAVDILVIPLIIQISYLFCNRRNVQTLLSSFNLKRFLGFVTSSKIDNSVKPMIYLTQASSESVL